MLLNKKEIKDSKGKLTKISRKIGEKCNFYYLCSDPTRLKIIFLLKNHKTLCPTDISQILNISISAVSHQVKMLGNAGLIRRTKKGKMVCYSLTEKSRKLVK
ncbi:winged helix-turn-helix transcriptional regulator [Patescibacteria group bacterium]|nr:winged helix-turn-helix transcriptional regulator [Patescibacteria group bacterium]